MGHLPVCAGLGRPALGPAPDQHAFLLLGVDPVPVPVLDRGIGESPSSAGASAGSQCSAPAPRCGQHGLRRRGDAASRNRVLYKRRHSRLHPSSSPARAQLATPGASVAGYLRTPVRTPYEAAWPISFRYAPSATRSRSRETRPARRISARRSPKVERGWRWQILATTDGDGTSHPAAASQQPNEG